MKQKKKKIAVDPGGDGQDYLGGGGETQHVDNVSTSLGPNGRPGSTRTTLLAASFFLGFSIIRSTLDKAGPVYLSCPVQIPDNVADSDR